MNITAHNIMNGIRKWIMEPDWNTIRLHLSHNDLDGYACHVMTKYATSIMNPNSKSSVTFWTSSAGSENIERAIMRFIERMEKVPKEPKKKYVKGKKKIFILVTDLGNFNPDFINKLIEDGHKINYICIDHHQTKDDLNKIELTGNTEEYQMAENCYYVDTSFSAAKSMGDAIRAILTQYRTASMLSPSDMKKYYGALEMIKEYANTVDLFDRGLWGEWVGLNETEIDNSVKEFLYFRSFKSEEKYRYVAWKVNVFHTVMVGTDLPKNERPYWWVDMRRFNSSYYKAVKSQLKNLNAEHARNLEILRPLSVDFNIPESFSNRDNLTIAELYIPIGSSSYFFTLSSKEILEKNPEIDILCQFSESHGTGELRTARDDLNLAEIAFANGGGGHQKAAGFPVPSIKKEPEEDESAANEEVAE